TPDVSVAMLGTALTVPSPTMVMRPGARSAAVSAAKAEVAAVATRAATRTVRRRSIIFRWFLQSIGAAASPCNCDRDETAAGGPDGQPFLTPPDCIDCRGQAAQ